MVHEVPKVPKVPKVLFEHSPHPVKLVHPVLLCAKNSTS
jgi:hypothetical protein